MKKAVFAVVACLAFIQPVFGSGIYSMQFDGPSFGGSGRSASLLAESVIVDSTVAAGSTSFWELCQTDITCSFVPGFTGIQDVRVGGAWDGLGLNASMNVDDSFTLQTSAVPGTYFGDARTTGAFSLNGDITSLQSGTHFGQRITFMGPGTYVTANSPEIVSATWSSFLDNSQRPVGYELRAETAFQVVLNVVDSGLNRDANFSDVTLYDGSFSGTGAAGFDFRKSDYLSGIDFSNRVGIISIRGQQTLTIFASAVPEPSLMTLFGLASPASHSLRQYAVECPPESDRG